MQQLIESLRRLLFTLLGARTLLAAQVAVGSALLMVPATSGQNLGLYWPHSTGGGGSIEHVSTDGSGFVELITGLRTDVRGIAIDHSARKMYWSSSLAINRANLDGTHQKVIHTGLLGVTAYTGVAVDVGAGKLYWLDSGDANSLNRSNLNGSDPEVVAPAGITANGLAVDTVNGRIYWTDQNAASIRCVDLNGNDLQSFQVSNAGGTLASARDIAVDTINGKLYWAAPDIGLIQRANLDGSNQEDLIGAVSRSRHSDAGILESRSLDRFALSPCSFEAKSQECRTKRRPIGKRVAGQ